MLTLDVQRALSIAGATIKDHEHSKYVALQARVHPWVAFESALQCATGGATEQDEGFPDDGKDKEAEPWKRNSCKTSTKESCTQPPDRIGLTKEEISSLGLRYFTPSEVARLHSFPEDLSFPEHITLRQQYALLGNSVSALVIGDLLQYLLHGSDADRL